MADEQVTSLGSSGNTLWALSDNLASVRDIADFNESTGVTSITNHRTYNSFGKLTSETNAAVDLVFGYTGKYLDDATGYQNNVNRWYDSNLGQWFREDPSGFDAGDANLRRYVNNEPTDQTDPYGLSSEWTEYQKSLEQAEHVYKLAMTGYSVLERVHEAEELRARLKANGDYLVAMKNANSVLDRIMA